MATTVRRLAVITGATSGIGQEVAQIMADNGWDLAINNLEQNEQTQAVVADLADRGANVFFARCDVGNKSDVQAFYARLEQHFDRAPDLVVNNAGVQTWSPLLELEENDWDRVINTVLKGSFLNTQIGAQLMIKHQQAGAIVNIGSGCNKLAFPNLVDYTAAKGGVEMLTKTAAIELGRYQIRVNCVAPGGILIDRTRAESPDYEGDWSRIAPLNRVGLPKDIANAILFFADSQSDFITGQTLWVDGGVFSKANWPY